LDFDSLNELLRKLFVLVPRYNTRPSRRNVVRDFVYLSNGSQLDSFVEVCLSIADVRPFGSGDVPVTVENFVFFLDTCRLGLSDSQILSEFHRLLFSHLPSEAPIFQDPRFNIFDIGPQLSPSPATDDLIAPSAPTPSTSCTPEPSPDETGENSDPPIKARFVVEHVVEELPPATRRAV